MEINSDLCTIFKMPSLKKEYTATNEKDIQDIEHGRCPDYALYWPEKTNKQYWPEGHNFYKGYNEEPKEEPKTNEETKTNETSKTKDELKTYYKLWRQIAEKKALKEHGSQKIPYIFCSLSLLVCDIDDEPSKLNLSKYGQQLWEVIKNLQHFIVISNQNNQNNQNKKYKKDWCKSHLETINIVTYDTLKREEKYIENPYILIDYEDIKEITNPKKIFIQYTNINETLSNLLQNI
jgi:hypothetical protein